MLIVPNASLRAGTEMLKWVIFLFLIGLVFIGSGRSVEDEEVYIYEDDDYNNRNDTEDYEIYEGREEHHLGEIRPAYPMGHHYPHGSGHLNSLSSLFNYHNGHLGLPGFKKKKKLFKRKQYQYMMPLMLTAMAKIAHFLPVVKLILLILFAIVLFSKKALLVSLGSLILVLYDTFYKGRNYLGVNVVKDRGSTVPTVEKGVPHSDEPMENPEEAWWVREQEVPSNLNPRDDMGKGSKWRRWWAPQINYKRKLTKNMSISNRELQNENLLRKNLEDIISQI